ncbi:RES domain-containing protein [Bradyrhizobium sp. SZCCHNRI1029]|uniref:RES domain-containing protein n=1 Tax=Bradyrhizobium sp. SZCCHNRI1029 TaxID=3057278 RepID=UPI002916E186|nr:RES domain-containing protein [Bradyrhizobium sp. SZCCHNRI1029]
MTQASEETETGICEKCIGNRQFAEWIVRNGHKGECEFDSTHGVSDGVVSLEEFAEEVDRYFRETYQLGEEYMYATEDSDNPSYDTYGEPYEDILANDLECDARVLSAIVDNLPDCSHRDIAKGAERFYTDENYEPIAAAESRHQAEEEDRWYEYRFAYQWGEFCEIVQYQRRFFKIKELLDDLFGKPEEYEGGAIKPVYALKAGQKIYRARILDDQFTFDRLTQNPAMELGAPPRDKARAGRMNVEYIPAFYAAFSEETAIAELRPGINDQLAVGTFVLQKDVRVFDFAAFSRPDSDWKDLRVHTRYEFITQMEDEISKPLRSFEKHREYIATQIVAEYLREHFNCDAVIYKSSMVRGNKTDNRNIVILDRGVEFVGAGRTLVLASHDIRDIGDIIYQISPGIPF